MYVVHLCHHAVILSSHARPLTDGADPTQLPLSGAGRSRRFETANAKAPPTVLGGRANRQRRRVFHMQHRFDRGFEARDRIGRRCDGIRCDRDQFIIPDAPDAKISTGRSRGARKRSRHCAHGRSDQDDRRSYRRPLQRPNQMVTSAIIASAGRRRGRWRQCRDVVAQARRSGRIARGRSEQCFIERQADVFREYLAHDGFDVRDRVLK